MEGHIDNSANEADLAFLKEKQREYMAQGVHEVEAMQQATTDLANKKAEMDQVSEEAWDQITKKIGLAEFLDDQMRRALGSIKTVWESNNNGHTLDFKLHLKTRGGVGNAGNKRLIAGVSLYLEYAIDGLWVVLREKRIDFVHVREMRDGNKWKTAIHEALLHDVFAWGINYMILTHQYKNGNIRKPNDEPPADRFQQAENATGQEPHGQEVRSGMAINRDES